VSETLLSSLLCLLYTLRFPFPFLSHCLFLMGDPYGLPEDLRRFIPPRTHMNPSNTHLLEPLCLHHGLSAVAAAATTIPPNTYDPNMVGDVFFPRAFTHFAHHHDYSSSSGVNPTNAATGAVSDHAFCSMESAEKGWFGFDSGNNRWPRQETLSLLEIRSRLDCKFRENNQKAPLWNEISRYMYTLTSEKKEENHCFCFLFCFQTQNELGKCIVRLRSEE